MLATCIPLATLCLLAPSMPANAADGWYLLAPPWRPVVEAGQDELDTTVRLAKWEQMGAYDSARICESARLGIIQALEKGDKERLDRAARSYLRNPNSDALETKEGKAYAQFRFAAIRVRASRCVSASDARLRD